MTKTWSSKKNDASTVVPSIILPSNFPSSERAAQDSSVLTVVTPTAIIPNDEESKVKHEINKNEKPSNVTVSHSVSVISVKYSSSSQGKHDNKNNSLEPTNENIATDIEKASTTPSLTTESTSEVATNPFLKTVSQRKPALASADVRNRPLKVPSTHTGGSVDEITIRLSSSSPETSTSSPETSTSSTQASSLTEDTQDKNKSHVGEADKSTILRGQQQATKSKVSDGKVTAQQTSSEESENSSEKNENYFYLTSTENDVLNLVFDSTPTTPLRQPKRIVNDPVNKPAGEITESPSTTEELSNMVKPVTFTLRTSGRKNQNMVEEKEDVEGKVGTEKFVPQTLVEKESVKKALQVSSSDFAEGWTEKTNSSQLGEEEEKWTKNYIDLYGESSESEDESLEDFYRDYNISQVYHVAEGFETEDERRLFDHDESSDPALLGVLERRDDAGFEVNEVVLLQKSGGIKREKYMEVTTVVGITLGIIAFLIIGTGNDVLIVEN